MSGEDTHSPRKKKKKNDALPQRKTLQLDTARITEAYFNFQQQSIHLEVATAMKRLQSHDKRSIAGGPQVRLHDALVVTSCGCHTPDKNIQKLRRDLLPGAPVFFFFLKRKPTWVFLFCFNIYLFIYLFIFGCVGSSFSVRGLSLVAASGGHSSSQCAGLSLSWPLLLRSTGSRRTGSVVVAHGPSCSAACGILPAQGSNPCPLHWQADSQPLRHQGSPVPLF